MREKTVLVILVGILAVVWINAAREIREISRLKKMRGVVWKTVSVRHGKRTTFFFTFSPNEEMLVTVMKLAVTKKKLTEHSYQFSGDEVEPCLIPQGDFCEASIIVSVDKSTITLRNKFYLAKVGIVPIFSKEYSLVRVGTPET